MTKVFLLLLLWTSSLLALGQGVGETRILAKDYRAQPLEEASVTLAAANIVPSNHAVEYRAGKAVLLLPGFQAKATASFLARIALMHTVFSEKEEALTISAYPNPFDEMLTIKYVLTASAQVYLTIRDIEGKEMCRLVDGKIQEAGYHQIEWSTDLPPAGLYFCNLDAGDQKITRRIVRCK